MGELQTGMTQVEFQAWMAFYRRWPFDDMHRYHRPAALVAWSMAGGDVQERLDWLQPPTWTEGFSGADLRTLRALGLKPPEK